MIDQKKFEFVKNTYKHTITDWEIKISDRVKYLEEHPDPNCEDIDNKFLDDCIRKNYSKIKFQIISGSLLAGLGIVLSALGESGSNGYLMWPSALLVGLDGLCHLIDGVSNYKNLKKNNY